MGGIDPLDQGYNEYGGYTCDIIAKNIGVSVQRVHQILNKAMTKLKKEASPELVHLIHKDYSYERMARRHVPMV